VGELITFVIMSFFAWNAFNEIMKSIHKRKDIKESRRKQAIFSPQFEKYYPKIKELKTVYELELYKKTLPSPSSREIKELEEQTGRNIIHEAHGWIEDDIKEIKEHAAKLQEKKRKKEKIKQERDAWANSSNKLKKSKGFVYILSNTSMPNIVKIGYSTKKPHDRAKELYTTGVPTPFNVLHAWGTPTESRARRLEGSIHQKFANLRIHGNREFFQIECLPKVKIYLEEQVGNEINYN
jgi:T5orf172 domain